MMIRDDEAEFFLCPCCGGRERHPMDIRAGYCGYCHDFTGSPTILSEHLAQPCAIRSAYGHRLADSEAYDSWRAMAASRGLYRAIPRRPPFGPPGRLAATLEAPAPRGFLAWIRHLIRPAGLP